MNAYSHLKPFRHPGVLHSIQAATPVAVPHVELILTDICQQHCSFCAYRLPGYAANQLFDDRRAMAIEKALEIIDDCADIGVAAIQFTGGGEPTLHPGFRYAICRTHLHGMKFSVVSNGVLVDEDLASRMIKASWVRISLDAATEDTYVKMRRVHRNHWDRAQRAVSHLRAAKEAAGSSCEIGVGFVVMPENWREVYDAAELAKRLGADNIRISAMFSNEDERLFAEFHEECARLCVAAEGLTDETFTVYNRFGDRINDLRLHSPADRLCGYQFFTTYIGADLNVYRCCGYAYNERGLVGSIKQQRFRDFWLSQERVENQLSFDARGCARCQFRKQNEAIAYAVAPQVHEEFV